VFRLQSRVPYAGSYWQIRRQRSVVFT